MPSNSLLPTLSDLAWTNDSTQVLDRLMSYFYISDYSQSYLYQDHISSLPKIIQDNADNIDRTASEITNTLRKLLLRYFKEAEVEVLDTTKDPNSSYVTLSMYVKVVDNQGKSLTYARLLETKDTMIYKITQLINKQGE